MFLQMFVISQAITCVIPWSLVHKWSRNIFSEKSIWISLISPSPPSKQILKGRNRRKHHLEQKLSVLLCFTKIVIESCANHCDKNKILLPHFNLETMEVNYSDLSPGDILTHVLQQTLPSWMATASDQCDIKVSI